MTDRQTAQVAASSFVTNSQEKQIKKIFKKNRICLYNSHICKTKHPKQTDTAAISNYQTAYYQQIIKLSPPDYLAGRFMRCSITITIITPIAKPFPTSGSMTEGTIPRGIIWKRSATIIGRPMVRPSAKLWTDFVLWVISKPAANCVPIKKRSITPITGFGMLVRTNITSGKSAHTTNSSVAGSSAQREAQPVEAITPGLIE